MEKERIFLIDADAASLVQAQQALERHWGDRFSIVSFHTPMLAINYLLHEFKMDLTFPSYIYLNLEVDSFHAGEFLLDMKWFKKKSMDCQILFTCDLDNLMTKNMNTNAYVKVWNGYNSANFNESQLQ